MIIGTLCLLACTKNNNESSLGKSEQEKDTVEINNEELVEGVNNFKTNPWDDDGIYYKKDIIFNYNQQKFVRMANNTYEELPQEYKETNIKYDKFDITVKWYICHDDERILYNQVLDVGGGETYGYIVTEMNYFDTYLLLCDNSTSGGYSYEYPLKFNVETGEVEDIFANATIDGKCVKDYMYLKNWEFKKSGIYVDCDESFVDLKSQKWKRKAIEMNN